MEQTMFQYQSQNNNDNKTETEHMDYLIIDRQNQHWKYLVKRDPHREYMSFTKQKEKSLLHFQEKKFINVIRMNLNNESVYANQNQDSIKDKKTHL